MGGVRLRIICKTLIIVICYAGRPDLSHAGELGLVHGATAEVVARGLVLLVVVAVESSLMILATVGARVAVVPVLDVESARVAGVPVRVLLGDVGVGGT